MVGLINLGSGIAAMGQSLAESSLLGEKDALENQKMVLANQLQEGTETRLQGLRGQQEIAQIGATGEQARQTAQTSAEAQGGQQRETAQYTNTLPMSAAEKADIAVRNRQASAAQTSASAAIMEANKPISGGFTGAFLVRDPASGKWGVQSSMGNTPDIKVDPNSNNLSAQTGLSDQAIKLMTGQTKGQRLGQYQSQMLEKEITDWGIKNNVNTSTLIPQATAANNVLQNNIQRNNQAGILENEISGSVDNASQIADDIHQGRIQMANVLNVWAGKQVNDPKTIQAADQLGRLRNELAGYNAVAGGHLMQNGTPEPTPNDFREAETTISNGINSGGLKALSQSVAMSAAKNRNVLESSIDKANGDFFSLFNAKYHSPNRAVEAAPGSVGAGTHAPSGKLMPQAGDVQGGYTFQGGDPANPANWRQIH